MDSGKLFAIIFCLFMVAGCVTTARLYNLESGEILHGNFENLGTGHGQVTA